MAQVFKVPVASYRGDWRNYADNSIEGIESCIRMGVDIVEIDVAKTKDGQLILMHDWKIGLTCKTLCLEQYSRINRQTGGLNVNNQ
jgi:glycerophosphoryl diester phosphodiesterase